MGLVTAKVSWSATETSPGESDISLEVPRDKSPLDFNLELPEPLIGVDEGNEYFAYTKFTFAVVLKIFAHYRFFTIVYPDLIETIGKQEYQLEIAERAIDMCKKTIKAARSENDYLVGLAGRQNDAIRDQRRKNLMTGLLVGGGGLVVGVGIGILIGVFGV
jgi:hypothetical protein